MFRLKAVLAFIHSFILTLAVLVCVLIPYLCFREAFRFCFVQMGCVASVVSRVLEWGLAVSEAKLRYVSGYVPSKLDGRLHTLFSYLLLAMHRLDVV